MLALHGGIVVVNQGTSIALEPIIGGRSQSGTLDLFRSTKFLRGQTTQEDVDLKNRDGLCAILITAYPFAHVEV